MKYKTITTKLDLLKTMLLLGLFFGATTSVLAQGNSADLAKFRDENGWYQFVETPFLTADFFVKYGSSLGLSPDDSIVQVRQEKDMDGLIHTRYSQYYKSILVENSAFLTHSSDADFIEVAHGTLGEKIDISVEPEINISDAKELVVNALDLDGLESIASIKLIIFSKMQEVLQSDFRLAYKMEVRKSEGNRIVYLDANTGDIITEFDPTLYENEGSTEEHNTDCAAAEENGSKTELLKPTNTLSLYEDGTCSTWYNGTRTISTHNYGNCQNFSNGWWNGCDYRLDDWRNIATYTFTLNNNGGLPDGTVVSKTSNNWGTDFRDETTSHWAAQQTVDYFRNIYTRSGPDGNNRVIRIYAGEETNPLNSYFSTSSDPSNSNYDFISIQKTANSSGGYTSAACIDIVAHEVVHSYVHSTSNLNQTINSGEPRALNESFADIFGEVIQKYATGSVDWIHGNDINLPLAKYNSRRSFTDSTFGVATERPLVFMYNASVTNATLGTKTWTQLSPYQQIGVPMRSFYLLVNGGTVNTITVNGIGMDKAAKIAYQNMAYYLYPGCGFAQARTGALNAAIAIYGKCSEEVRQVRNAWRVVGIGGNTENSDNCGSVIGSNWTVCYPYDDTPPNRTFTYTKSTYPVNLATTWSGALGWQMTVNGNNITVNTNGIGGSLKLKVNGQVLDSRTITYRTCGRILRQANPNNQATVVDVNKNSIYIVYPNPVSNQLNVVTTEAATAKLVSVNGQVLKEIILESNILKNIDLSNIERGIYFLNINTATQNFVERIVVVK